MAELESLSFRVESSQLVEAAKRIQELTAAIEALSAKEKSAATVAKETAATERQKIKDAEKLEQLKRKLAEAEAKAAAATNGNAGATRTALTEGEKMANLLSRLTNLHHDMAAGSTRGESAILQMARSLNATDAQMQAVRASLQQIAGLSASPFDNSLGAIRSVQREMQALDDRARLAAQGISLTSNQLKEYSRLGNEIRGQMSAQNLDPTQGSGLVEFNRRLAEEQARYIGIANSVNTLTSEEKKRNDVLTTQRNIMAELEQKNLSIQESISRNNAMTLSMQGGVTQTQAGTNYDNSKLIASAATPEQLARIQERITLTQKLTESEKLLNIEVKAQEDSLKHIEGLTAQRKAIDDLNKSVIANVAERKKMDDLMQKYTGMGLNNTNASEVSKLEFKGASQASIDSLKTYLLGVQQVTKAKEDQKKIDDDINAANQRAAREAAATRYSGLGHSSTISNTAAGMEIKGVPTAAIQSYIQDATAKEQSNKATRELTAAKKYLIETEERIAAAVNNANQNLNRQSTDELVKYQKALTTVGTSAAEAERKLGVFKAQQEAVAAKARDAQLNHLSRGISTQMGDVGISLASGMNPLTVALQQGDQIRGLLVQAGAEGAELQKAMNGAASQIASSIAITFKAMSGFITGIVTTSAKAISSLVTAPIQFYKDCMLIQADLTSGSITQAEKVVLLAQSWSMLKGALTGAAKIAIGLGVVALSTLAVSAYQVMKEHDALVVTLSTMGGTLGLTTISAENYARSLNSVGIATNKGIEVISEMSKAGVFVKEDIDMVAKAAVDMYKYGGVAIADTIKEFAKMKKDPVDALVELAKATGNITPETIKAAIEMKHMGDTAGATKIAMQALADSTGDSVNQMKSEFTGFALWAKNFGAQVSSIYDNVVKDMWRGNSEYEKLRKRRKALEGVIGGDVGGLLDPNTRGVNLFDKKAASEALAQTNLQMKAIEDLEKVRGEQKAKESASNSLVNQAKINTEKYQTPENRMLKEKLELLGQVKTANDKLVKGLVSKAAVEQLELENGKAVLILDKRIKEAEEARAKKDKGPKAKTSSFGGVPSEVSLVNNTPNIQREYSSELGKQEKFFKSKRDILKLDYEAGLVSRGAYISQDIALIVKGQNKEFEVINSFGGKVKAEQKRITDSINARRAEALDATKDPKSRIKINLDADNEVKKVEEAGKTFTELQTDRTDTTAFEATKRYKESIKEQNLSIIDSKKHLTDLNKSMQDISESRLLDIEFQFKAMSVSGSELESYKARNEVLKDYVKTKDRIKNSIKRETGVYTDMVANSDGSKESQDRIMQQWQIVQTLKDQVIKAGIDSEEQARLASIDAVSKYYMNKAMEVRDGTANAITEAITNGGQAGSKAIKGVLDSILKDLLNNAFKKILGSVGDMILQSVMQAQAASIVASSGGGFFESLFKMGLSAAAGSMGGGSAGATSQYSLSSGSTDMTSGLKRATGGFVNQGSEYTVGENGPEKFIPKQTGSIVPNHDLAKSNSSEPLKLTIINNTSAPIGRVTERQISPTERALVIEDAVAAVAASLHDPNHKVSKSFGQNFSTQRRR